MFKVLNELWEIIVVSKIDTTKHRHLSWREFNSDDKCLEATWEVETELTMTREEAIEQYITKYGKKPNHMMKTETIISKL